MDSPNWPQLPHFKETALIVNPDLHGREALQHYFDDANYRVLMAGTADEALDLCRNYEGAIHILVADIDIPAISSWQLAETATEVRPGLIVLFLSAAALDKDHPIRPRKRPAASAGQELIAPLALAKVAQALSRRRN